MTQCSGLLAVCVLCPKEGSARRHRLKTQMEWCMAHPEELSKVAGLQKKVDEVKVRAGPSS